MNDEILQRWTATVILWNILASTTAALGLSVVIYSVTGGILGSVLASLFWLLGGLFLWSAASMMYPGRHRLAYERVFDSFDHPPLSEWDVENKWGEKV